MYYKVIDIIKDYIKKKNNKIFLIFVMISTLFWLLIKFSKQYTVTNTFPVKYQSIPDGLSWGKIEKSYITLSVNTSGFQQLNYYIFGKYIYLDMSKVKKREQGKYFLLPKEQMGNILNQFPGTVRIVYQTPDSLLFDFSKKISKKVVVKLNGNIHLAKTFSFVENVSTIPDSVTITGPESIIKNIHNVKTLLFTKENIHNNSKESIALESFENDKISISSKNVIVNIQVEKYTQNTIDIPISIENVPKGFLLKTFPDKVNIVYNTGLSNFKSVNTKSFKVIADYNKIIKNNTQYIPLSVEVLSNKIELVKTQPSDVEFLLREIHKPIK